MGSPEQIGAHQVIAKRTENLKEFVDTNPDAAKIVAGFIDYFDARAARNGSQTGVHVPRPEDPSLVNINSRVDSLTHQIFSAHRAAGAPNPEQATVVTLKQVTPRRR